MNYWDQLSFDEIAERIVGAPVLAADWRTFEGGLLIEPGAVRDRILPSNLSAETIAEVWLNQLNQWVWRTPHEVGIAENLEEAKKLADEALTKHGILIRGPNER